MNEQQCPDRLEFVDRYAMVLVISAIPRACRVSFAQILMAIDREHVQEHLKAARRSCNAVGAIWDAVSCLESLGYLDCAQSCNEASTYALTPKGLGRKDEIEDIRDRIRSKYHAQCVVDAIHVDMTPPDRMI